MSRRCGIDGLGDAVAKIVADFADETDEEIDRAVRAGAKATLSELRSVEDPQSHHGYAEGWKASYESRHFGEHRAVIHNAAKPGLPHLLEFGHEMWVGGHDTGRRVPAHPHVAPAAETGKEAMLGALGQ